MKKQYKIWLEELPGSVDAPLVSAGWFYYPDGIYQNLPLYGRTNDKAKAAKFYKNDVLQIANSFLSNGYKLKIYPRITIKY